MQTGSLKLRVGVAGLGGAARLVLPAFAQTEHAVLAGGADPRPEAREAFTQKYHKPAYDSVEALSAADDVDAIWIETPNHLHCAHALIVARAGKHIICAKPLAATLEECDRMIEAAEAAGVQLLQGHSKIFDAPIQAMRALIGSGRLGRAIQVNTLLFNDWLQRPRLEEELDPAKGGGVVMRQGPHLVDIATYLIGKSPRAVRAVTGAWDPNFNSPGNFSALLSFDDGEAASLAFNGYGYFDSAELHWGIGAAGSRRDTRQIAPVRRTGPISVSEKYAAPEDDIARARRAAGEFPPFFGLTIVSCERGVLRQSPEGLFIYTESGVEELAVSPSLGRAAELAELSTALTQGRRAFPDGVWAKATLQTCLAITASAQQGSEIKLREWSS